MNRPPRPSKPSPTQRASAGARGHDSLSAPFGHRADPGAAEPFMLAPTAQGIRLRPAGEHKAQAPSPLATGHLEKRSSAPSSQHLAKGKAGMSKPPHYFTASQDMIGTTSSSLLSLPFSSPIQQHDKVLGSSNELFSSSASPMSATTPLLAPLSPLPTPASSAPALVGDRSPVTSSASPRDLPEPGLKPPPLVQRRLLKDARAAALNVFRPETPVLRALPGRSGADPLLSNPAAPRTGSPHVEGSMSKTGTWLTGMKPKRGVRLQPLKSTAPPRSTESPHGEDETQGKAEALHPSKPPSQRTLPGRKPAGAREKKKNIEKSTAGEDATSDGSPAELDPTIVRKIHAYYQPTKKKKAELPQEIKPKKAAKSGAHAVTTPKAPILPESPPSTPSRTAPEDPPEVAVVPLTFLDELQAADRMVETLMDSMENSTVASDKGTLLSPHASPLGDLTIEEAQQRVLVLLQRLSDRSPMSSCVPPSASSSLLSPEVETYLLHMIRRVYQSRLNYQTAKWNEANKQRLSPMCTSSSTELPSPPEDPRVAVRAIILLLEHRGVDLLGDPDALLDMLSLLQSVMDWPSFFSSEVDVLHAEEKPKVVGQDSLLCLLLRLLEDERSLAHPEVLSHVLSILEVCTDADDATNSASRSASPVLQPLPPSHPASRLITLGMLPVVTDLARLLLHKVEEEEEKERNEKPNKQFRPDDSESEEWSEEEASMKEWYESLVSSICLIFRNVSLASPHLLLEQGALDILILALYMMKDCTAVVEAASRALAKLVFHEPCLAALASNLNFMRAALQAMSAQLGIVVEEGSEQGPATAVRARELEGPSVHLLVSRLAGAMARVAEQSEDQCDMLARHGVPMVLALLGKCATLDETSVPSGSSSLTHGVWGFHALAADAVRYGNVSPKKHGSSTPKDLTGTTIPASPSEKSAEDGTSNLPLLQAIVWLVGVMGLSPLCGESLVLKGVSGLLQLLREIPSSPQTRPLRLYVLLALSNLSYFFAPLERYFRESCQSPSSLDAIAVLEEDEEAVLSLPSVNAAEHRQQSAQQLDALCESLGLVVAGYMLGGDAEATVEATRIISNLCLTVKGSEWVEENHVDEVLVLFMGHEDLRIVFNCTGALLNLTAGSRCRIVEEPELTSMLLQYTGKYTTRSSIKAAAEKELQWSELQKQQGQAKKVECESQAAFKMSDPSDAEVEWSHVEQIADLVSRLLHNVSGLLKPRNAV